MSEPSRESPPQAGSAVEAAPGGSSAPAPEAASDERSPFRSGLAIGLGFVAFQILGSLYGAIVYRLAAAEFAEAQDGGRPTDLGLGLVLAGALPNGLVAGAATARFSGRSPLGHAAVLAGLMAFLGMVTSGEAQGLPGWFALGRALAPPVAVLLGGLAGRRAVR